MEPRYSCLIVDDEFPAHEVINILLKNFNEIVFSKSVYNGQDAILEINIANKYDIVFLDINMPLFNGIEVLKNTKNKPEIIITTAYTEFAFDAYQNDAVAYLQKPFTEDNFSKAVKKAVHILKNKSKENLKNISVKIDGFNRLIDQNEILYLRSLGNYTKLIIKNSEKAIIVNESFSKQFSKLESNNFIQIHRTCIVNKKHIVKRKENNLVMTNNHLLPIGRKYSIEIANLFIKLQ